MAWRPGSHSAALALEDPYEDVPEHLVAPLWTWVSGHCRSDSTTMLAVGLRLRLSLPDPRRDRTGAVQGLAAECQAKPTLILDAIEVLLPFVIRAAGGHASIATLNNVLKIGNSMYQVKPDHTGLELRVLPEVREAVQAAVDAATGSAGEHLAMAWSEAYGRSPDAVKAYSEAIKAVEAAAAPVISPSNPKATLGTIIRDIKAKPSKWQFAVAANGDDGVVAVQRLMELLWNAQTSRHGGVAQTVPETAEAARAAVHVAATLVQFFVGKSITVR